MLGLALLKDESLCDGAIMYSAFINAHPKFVFSKWVRDAFSIGPPFHTQLNIVFISYACNSFN